MAGRTRRAKAEVPPRLILDSGAVIALARGDQRARAFVARAIETGSDVEVPSVVVAETIRGNGPRDAPVNRVLNTVDSVMAADEAAGRAAGGMLGASRSDATVDALVVACAAVAGGGRILTGDRDDLARLARSVPGVVVHAV